MRLSKYGLRILVAVVLALLLFLAAVPFLGFAWHVFNRGWISYAGWRVQVPQGFFPTNVVTRPTFWRHSLGAPLWNRAYGQISIFKSPSGPVTTEQARRDVEAAYVTVAQWDGYTLQAKREIPVANTTAYCWEFARPGEQPEFSVRCVIAGSALSPWYSGARKWAPDFYAMLGGMAPER